VSLLQVLAVALAGLAAGAINAAVGSGSLLTFPTLLAVGYAPVVANMSNSVGLVFGSISGAVGYRRELRGQARRLLLVAPAAALGGLIGALLLLVLPQQVFNRVVIALIVVAVILVIAQPRITRALSRHRQHRVQRLALPPAVFGTAVYGGYFGAAQGVIMLALLGILVDDELQRLNGLKNALTVVINGTSAVVFAFSGRVDWKAAAIIAVASLAGGQLGAFGARRLRPEILRVVIVLGGVAALLKLLL
jgi:uncharacterized membrane protein YfcA